MNKLWWEFADGQCYSPCSGDAIEICGGGRFKASVYNTTTPGGEKEDIRRPRPVSFKIGIKQGVDSMTWLEDAQHEKNVYDTYWFFYR